jgi:hypothetical protein
MRHVRLLLPILLLLAGCGSDPDGPSGRIDPPEGYAASPDEAVRFLRNAFLTVDLPAMEHVLHPDFEFELSSTDADLLGLSVGSTWDRATHLEWCTNLFGGQPGIRADGVVQNPLDLDFGFSGLWLSDDDEWADVTDGPLAGTQRRTYQGVWSIQYTGGDLDFVQGNQTFYVQPHDVEFPDGIATVYEVVHWYSENVVPPGAKKHETISWGLFIAKFRFDEILDPPAGYAASADDVVTLLQQAYENLDMQLLTRLLHPTFQFQLDPTEAGEFSLDEFLDRDAFTATTARMFAGDAGLQADGSDQAGLDVTAGLTGPWSAVDAGWTLVSQGSYRQTLERTFDGAWTADFSDASSITVGGVQTFNVVEGVVEVGDSLARVHQLRRWASAPPQEGISWGRLTAWYQSPAQVR